VALLYVACAKLGLALAISTHQVTAVWPPTGFAIAAVLRLGRRSAVGIFLGALLANATADEPFAVATGIAMGNTLEAIFAVTFLRHFEFDAALASVRDVLLLVAAIALSPIVAASVGVASLGAGGVHPLSALPGLWWIWWTGDAMGGLIVTPFLLVVGPVLQPARGRRVRGPAPHVEGIIGLVLLAAVCATSFIVLRQVHATEYVVFPFMIWAAFRFGPLGTATVAVLSNAIAIWGTHLGRGPFAGAGPEQGLVLLQVFMAVVVTTGLLLGAVAAQNQQAQERKDEFLAMLGHELRNPLAPIVHAVELLGRRDPQVAEQAREIIRRQAAHLTRLVDDLLDVSRITRGAIQLERRAVKLEEVVTAAADTWRHLAAQKHQRLSVEVAPRAIWIDVDPMRFTQVIANLLHNAIKFTPPEGSISVVAEAENGVAVVRVRDSGEGMDSELLDHAFDLFVQGPPALDRPRGGLGLGLTLVRRLAALHGGTVEARSDGIGEGSEFTIRVPMVAAPAIVEAATRAPEPERVARRVLIVEDHADTRQMLMLLVERDGHVVRGAADGLQAIEEAKEFAPEIVLLDIGLPGLDGYAVARELRALSPDVRLIALTGYGALEQEAPFDEHLLKPVEPAKLRELLM
jgi:signal transduction histidine kinase/CheY-like chemotaxis protein